MSNQESYRDAPVARAELESLAERVSALEARPPREPFVLRLWHTLVVGLFGLVAGIAGLGFVFDFVPNSGLKLSAYVTVGLVGVVGLLATTISLGALDIRDGLRDPWKLP